MQKLGASLAWILVTAVLCVSSTTVKAESTIPLMDMVDVLGIRSNKLVGYGLVVGLDGTGDKNQVKFTSQSIVNMMRQFGVQLGENVTPKLKIELSQVKLLPQS